MSEKVLWLTGTNLYGDVHLRCHELASCHNHIFALLGREMTVDVSGVFEQVGGISLQELYVLQSCLKFFRLSDHLEHKKICSINKRRQLRDKKKHNKLLFDSYSAVLLQLAAVVRDAVEKTLVDDAL